MRQTLAIILGASLWANIALYKNLNRAIALTNYSLDNTTECIDLLEESERQWKQTFVMRGAE